MSKRTKRNARHGARMWEQNCMAGARRPNLQILPVQCQHQDSKCPAQSDQRRNQERTETTRRHYCERRLELQNSQHWAVHESL